MSQPVGPYTPARNAGSITAFSGQIGQRDGKLVPGGFTAELEQALQNLGRLLEQSGLSKADVIKTTVFLADIRDWDKLNAPYMAFFGQPLPARTALAVAALPLGARVEIEAWAVRPS